MHALIEYYYLTGDERLRDSIIKMADAALLKPDSFNKESGGMLRKAVAFAARHAADGAKYRKSLEKMLSGGGARYAYQQVTANPAHWTGPTAFFMGGISGGLFWLSDASYVLGALDAEPAPSKSQEAEMKRLEEREPMPEPRAPRESWQSEYDKPEFKEYLKDRLAAPQADKK